MQKSLINTCNKFVNLRSVLEDEINQENEQR